MMALAFELSFIQGHEIPVTFMTIQEILGKDDEIVHANFD